MLFLQLDAFLSLTKAQLQRSNQHLEKSGMLKLSPCHFLMQDHD